MAWLSANTPRDRLPREAGIVMGLFSTGAVIGPGVGSFAHATSPLLAFSCLAGAAALTIPLAWRAPVGRQDRVRAQLHPLARDRCCATASCWPPSSSRSSIPVSLGAIDLLVPRHLHGNGVPTWHIGAALMVGAALGAIAGPLVGQPGRADRAAARGLIAATALVALPTILIPASPTRCCCVVLVAVAPAFTILATAMYPLSTRGADARGVSHGVVNGVISVTWATAFAIGSLASGVLADHHGDTATYAVVAVVCASLLAGLAIIARGTPRVVQAA